MKPDEGCYGFGIQRWRLEAGRPTTSFGPGSGRKKLRDRLIYGNDLYSLRIENSKQNSNVDKPYKEAMTNDGSYRDRGIRVFVE